MIQTRLKTAALTAMVLALGACQTTAPAQIDISPEQQLFSSLQTSKYDGSLPTQSLSAEDPTCLQFYTNATQYVGRNTAKGGGSGLLKTVALGMLAGVASGGVGAIGIGSTFLETAVAGTANQMVFQGGQKVLEGKAEPQGTDPMVTVNDAAQKLGCPPLNKASMKAAKKAAKALKKKNEAEGT